MRNTIIVFGILLLVSAVVLIMSDGRGLEENQDETNEETAEETETEDTNDSPDTPLDFENATYRIEADDITLEEGRYEEEVTSQGGVTMTTYAELVETTEGDLSDDKDTDGAALLIHHPGGSALFFYISGIVRTESGQETTETVRIGDRIDVQSLEIEEGVIEVTYLRREDDEPFAADPSVEEVRRYQVEDGVLTEVSSGE